MTDNQAMQIMLRELIGDLFVESMERMLPSHMHDALMRYVLFGTAPGSFLEAVLSDSLSLAVIRADPNNFRGLNEWGKFMHDHMPSLSWGSIEMVWGWTHRGGLVGIRNKMKELEDG